jgi:integrase
MDGLKPPKPTLREGANAPEPEHVPDALEVGRIAHWLRSGDARTERNRLAGLLLLYSAQRRSCVAQARKSDFKVVGGVRVWAIPPMHRKTASIKARNGKKPGEHVLPLPDAAWEVVEKAKALSGKSTWLFPAMRPRRNGGTVEHMDQTLITHMFYDIPRCEASPHDIRRAFGTTFGDAERVRASESALILDHSEDAPPGDVTTTHYAWLNRLEEKAPILSKWADWVDAQETVARPIVEAEEKAEAEKMAREAEEAKAEELSEA